MPVPVVCALVDAEGAPLATGLVSPVLVGAGAALAALAALAVPVAGALGATAGPDAACAAPALPLAPPGALRSPRLFAP